MPLLDRILTVGRIITSALGPTNSSVMVNIQVSGEDDAEGEDGSTEEPLFGGPVVFRPLDPTSEGAAEAVVARVPDGLQPLTSRDLRLSKARGTVNKGAVGLPGYGGSFLSIDHQPSTGTDEVTIYVPDDSSPKKASLLSVNRERAVLLHKRGHYVALLDDGTVSLVSKSGQVFITVSDDGIALSGPLKTVTGALFGDVANAQPIMLAPALLAWIGETNTWIAAINTLLGTTGLAVSGALAKASVVPPVPSATPVASTKASASP